MKYKVQPFSNLTEFINWKDKNCDQCCRYENKSTNVNNSPCRLSFYLDLASVTNGLINSNTALKIGKKEYNGIESTCTLKDQCNNFNKLIKTYPKKRKIDKKQTKLFE